jgi:hypothetical protein
MRFSDQITPDRSGCGGTKVIGTWWHLAVQGCASRKSPMPDSGTHNPMKRGSASVPMWIALRPGTRPSPTLVLRARSKVWPGPCAPPPGAPVVRRARRAVCSIFKGPPVAENQPPAGDRTREVIIPRCAGLDVPNRTIGACVRRLGPDGRIDQEGGRSPVQ